jgi:hypothetical protein
MAVLADNPPAAAEEPKTIDFNCPQCDEPLHLPADLAGKRTSCPECRRIIKVPELVKAAPKDWRKLDPHLPSGARRPEVPVPEGAWASTSISAASRQALEQAGVIRQERPPIPLAKKIKWGAVAAGGAAALVLAAVLVVQWVGRSREQRALQLALDYANSDTALKQVGREGQALLHAGAGQYYLRANKAGPDGNTGPAEQAKKEFDRAQSLLDGGPTDEVNLEREVVLHGLAVAGVELGGDKAEVEKGRRLKWDDAQRVVVRALTAMREPEAQLEAFRAAGRRLIARGQPDRVQNVASLVYASSPNAAEALAVGALELLRAGNKQGAAKLADVALRVDAPAGGERPPLPSAVLALALALGKEVPAPGKAPGERENAVVGEAEGLALQGHWDEARRVAREKTPDAETRLRAWVGLAAAAVGNKEAGTADLEEAVRVAETELRGRRGMSWLLLRLTLLGTEAGMGDDRLQGVAAAIPDRAVRGQAQLALFRARLAASKQVVEEAAVGKVVDAETLSHLLAREELARHNIPLDSGWARVVQGWPEPQRAFGSLGEALARHPGP